MVDDHELMRRGVAELLTEEDDLLAWIHRLGWLVERVLTARMPLALRESGLSRT